MPYVEMKTADRALHHIAVEAKEYDKTVGIGIIRDFSEVVNSLRRLGKVDEGVIVSTSGFSKQARNRANEEGLRLLEPSDLAAMTGLPDREQMRADYLASLRQRFEYLDLGGIAPRVQNRTVKLRMDDVFIPVQARPELESHDDEWLDLDEGPPSEEMALRMLARRGWEGPSKPMEIPDLLGRSRVVILGDPGCGKSTLLRHIAYTVACGKTEDVGEAASKRLPIFVRIVQFSQALAQDATLTLDTYIREVVEPKWSLLFQHALDNGKAFVLLDGLDEVVDAHQRKGVSEAIQRLAADYPNNAFLVTSRIVGYQAARLSGDFAHYTIQPLPLESITTFVGKWYAAIEREAGETELSEEAQERAEELSRTIREQLGIRRMAENPLLLTIIALVNWRGRKLPNRRTELYAHAAETLIESWPYRRQGVTLNTERVIRLLSPVAYRIFATRSSGDITENDLLPILTDAICNVDSVDEHTAQAYARDFLSQISERSGIFRERGYDERGRRVFGFLHLTFAEYFTARYLANLWEEMKDTDARRVFLRKYAHVPRWHEVVLLMAGVVGTRDNDYGARTRRFLSDILMMDSDYEECLHRDLLLAGECLADNLRVQPKAAHHILDQLLILVAKAGISSATHDIFRSMRETTYGQYVLTCLLEQLGREDRLARAEIAAALGKFGDLRAGKELITLLEDSDRNVRARAVEALGRLGDLNAADSLMPRLEDEDWLVRGEAAEALGELGAQQAKDALQVLQQDKDRWVRLKATEALWKVDIASSTGSTPEKPEGAYESIRARAARTLGGLSSSYSLDSLMKALGNEKPDVRWSAALVLGEVDYTDTVADLLIARLNDDDAWVQWAAARALGEFGESRAVDCLIAQLESKRSRARSSAASALGKIGDAKAVKPLITRLKDRSWVVRRISATALGRLGDMQAVPALLELLEDNNKWVRGNAYQALVAILNHNAPQPAIAEGFCEPSEPEPWDS